MDTYETIYKQSSQIPLLCSRAATMIEFERTTLFRDFHETNLLNCLIYNTLSSRPNVHRLPGIIHNLSIRHRFYSSRAITMTFRITSCPRSRKGETSQTTKRKGIKESGISRQCPSGWIIDKLETFDRIEYRSILP